jgi:outer membrane protein assembly factor BamB
MREPNTPKYLYVYDGVQRRRRKRRKIFLRRLAALAVFCGVIVGGVFIYLWLSSDSDDAAAGIAESTTTTIPPLEMTVAPVAYTAPEAFDFRTDVFQGSVPLPSYARPEPIEFGRGSDYTDLEGIITFRGNNYREGASYGTAEVAVGGLEIIWEVETGSVPRSSGSSRWTGSGWTGQPLIVKWPEDIKQMMNIFPEKKADPDLVEVIYPCLDGKIYFLDLKDGSATRAVIETKGGAIKGTASLYPDGTPLLFVGEGDALPGSDPDGAVKYLVYNLLNQSLLYTFGTDDPVAYRKTWQAYDASALIDVETDTLIEPGENGLLYTIRLNTEFDKSTGRLTVSPEEPIKFRYTTPEYVDTLEGNTPSTRWWGMEDSPVAWSHYLYVSDNGGKFMCIDLNTMQLVWVQDVLDDSNSSPLFEESLEEEMGYIYTSSSIHITGVGDPPTGQMPVWKLNAATGDVVWESTAYTCTSRSGASGGVQGTGLLGQHDISNLVIYPIAGTPTTYQGLLVALDKRTGAEVWRFTMANYAWSSPVAVYTPAGKSYIVICDSAGKMFLLEGTTGQTLSSVILSAKELPIEASPAVYNDTIVIGSRGQRIYGVDIF